MSRRAIKGFLAEREQYKKAIKVQPDLSPIPWAGCFDALFFRSLVHARAPGAQYESFDELTDTLINTKLESVSSTTRQVYFDEAIAILRSLNIDSSEADGRLRIHMLQTSDTNLCGQYRWNLIKKNRKTVVKRLSTILQPLQLISRVEDVHWLQKSYLNGALFGFA